jgi:hypothetical protein
MAKVALLKETPLIQIIDKPILPLKKEKFRKIKGTGIRRNFEYFTSYCIFSVKILVPNYK